jgi:hypothetical protein
MRERILGRGAELQQVGALLADETPAGRTLVLTGDAGVGKTTIWEAGVRLAAERGRRVVAARPAEAEAALPFAALGDLLDGVADVVELPRPQRAALDRALQRAAVRWLDAPTEGVLAEAPPPPGQGDVQARPLGAGDGGPGVQAQALTAEWGAAPA